MNKKPPFRKLRGYAFDPSLSQQMDTALINDITYQVPWEDRDDPDADRKLSPGPSGEYVEVVDYDPTVEKFYEPVDLDDRYILASDGLDPSGSNPKFHQQMVYAVAMTTIKNFEKGLGRQVLWSSRTTRVSTPKKPAKKKATANQAGQPENDIVDEYIPKLRLYPHALREPNAYYSPQKKAILFGYFSARPADITLQMPDNLTFTCLSHDIIAHETTHAILDGLHRTYTDNSNPDVLAFHEAFADIIALFQHFTFPDVLKNQIAETRGDLASQNMLGKLAQEFGIAIGSYGALRDAIGYIDPKDNTWKPKKPNGDEYRKIMEPHARGSILVSAIFEAFLSIYKSRIADLLRIASNGTGILPQGELQTDLVNRLANEASKTANHVLGMCIRAVDYCPPVDITYGDFLRGIITGDVDLVADDDRNYRLAFIDAFRKRGIFPTGIKNLSVESLTYQKPDLAKIAPAISIIVDFLMKYRHEIMNIKSRRKIFEINTKYCVGDYSSDPVLIGLHRRLVKKFDNSEEFEKVTGLVFSPGAGLGVRQSEAYGGGYVSLFVQSLHLASRVGPEGNKVNQIIVTLVQHATINVTKDNIGKLAVKGVNDKPMKDDFKISGGCTLIFDLDTLALRYAISKPLLDVNALPGFQKLDEARCLGLYKYRNGYRGIQSQFQAYFGSGIDGSKNEPFHFLHSH